MDNDNTEPVFTVGILPKKCYTDPQELLNDIAAALSVPTDNAKVIKGAQGPIGPPGGRGDTGPPGPIGEAVTRNTQSHAIPINATFVDIPIFDQWQFSTYNIIYNGYDFHPTDPDFEDLAVVVGVGTIVPLYGVPDVLNLRVYLTFHGVPINTPDANFLLNIVTIQ